MSPMKTPLAESVCDIARVPECPRPMIVINLMCCRLHLRAARRERGRQAAADTLRVDTQQSL